MKFGLFKGDLHQKLDKQVIRAITVNTSVTSQWCVIYIIWPNIMFWQLISNYYVLWMGELAHWKLRYGNDCFSFLTKSGLAITVLHFWPKVGSNKEKSVKLQEVLELSRQSSRRLATLTALFRTHQMSQLTSLNLPTFEIATKSGAHVSLVIFA